LPKISPSRSQNHKITASRSGKPKIQVPFPQIAAPRSSSAFSRTQEPPRLGFPLLGVCPPTGPSLLKTKDKTGRGFPLPVLYYMPYFFLKRSTRPPASTNFCLPVKKGWHSEQISTRMFSLTDPVSNSLPQTQVTLVTVNFGWIACFILVTSFRPSPLQTRVL